MHAPLFLVPGIGVIQVSASLIHDRRLVVVDDHRDQIRLAQPVVGYEGVVAGGESEMQVERNLL
jgi:hypothetical protein